MAKVFDSPSMRETLRRLIRSRMAYKGFEYKDLCRALEALGVHQNESNLRSKVNNGSLGAQLFMYILLAMDTPALDLRQVQEILEDVSRAAGEKETGFEH
jgi:predicted NAD/FAD-binding protein